MGRDVRILFFRSVSVEHAIAEVSSERGDGCGGETYLCWHCSAMGAMRLRVEATSEDVR